MKKHVVLAAVAGLALQGVAMAESAVSVHIETQTHGDKTQTGSVSVTTDAGRSFSGHITGRVVNQSPEGFPVYLDHVLAIPGLGTIHTREDVALPAGAPSGCTMPVQEFISVQKGTGDFKNIVAAGVQMVGTLDVCTGRHVFDLASGNLSW